jgi:hypothetical protein
MLDEDLSGAADADLVLDSFDFPQYYVNMSHAEDGVVQDNPIEPQYIRYSEVGHSRMFVRISVRVGDKYVPYTFLCDTGLPAHLYLSEPAGTAVKKAGQIKKTEVGTPYMMMSDRVAAVRVTPRSHQPVNILGMLMLERLGLQMSEGSFTFTEPVDYL